MSRAKNLSLVLLSIFAVIIISCNEESGVHSTGRIEYIALEGGFYGIIGDDGVKYDPEPTPYLPASVPANVTVGSNGSSLFIDAQLSDVIFSSVARSDTELQERGVLTSLPVDSSTIYKLGLNGSLN